MQGRASVTRAGGEAVWVFDDLVEILLDGAATGGAYCVLEDWPAPGFNPVLHRHRDEDEIVRILAGEFLLRTEDGEEPLEPGALVRVPKGVAHAFPNVGSERGHRQIVFSPAGPEELWRAVGRPATDRTRPPAEPVDQAAFLAAAQRHGLEIVPSPRV
jgi:mannose-6-phosphate isomerase-like protein (cupin superfamily)